MHLWHVDPMNTYCKENWAFNEYSIEAKYLIDVENVDEIQKIFLLFFDKKINDNIVQKLFTIFK